MSYFPSHLDGTWACVPRRRSAAPDALSSTLVSRSAPFRASTRQARRSLWQSAGVVVTSVASGLSYAWIAGHTGLEARLIGQMMNGCAGMAPGPANELAQKIMRKVDELLPRQEKQLPFCEAYDVNTVKPRPEYEKAMLQTRDELAALGMPFVE
jgi:hypothetical protein